MSIIKELQQQNKIINKICLIKSGLDSVFYTKTTKELGCHKLQTPFHNLVCLTNTVGLIQWRFSRYVLRGLSIPSDAFCRTGRKTVGWEKRRETQEKWAEKRSQSDRINIWPCQSEVSSSLPASLHFFRCTALLRARKAPHSWIHLASN